ncbi:hotdog fold thioesterase [Georgenia sp. SYP-B2076]|uniref:hotdog fold thioesterase n=1 Tax=Georgenia sp. SYP-B2076 TaxID=2495881 RepID=UPI000F8CC1B7|nr:hotdog fold thioesterase [Georgenia sp. SYP-B2076]
MNDTDDVLTALRAASVGTLVERLGIEVLEARPERVVARMPVAGNTQPHGLLHGGASAALAETVGSFAATIHAGPGRAAVGTEISATHHRGVSAGSVTATATALFEGRRTATYEIVIVDDEGRRTCTARLSCMLVERPGGDAATNRNASVTN